jgi:hypothetical protein
VPLCTGQHHHICQFMCTDRPRPSIHHLGAAVRGSALFVPLPTQVPHQQTHAHEHPNRLRACLSALVSTTTYVSSCAQTDPDHPSTTWVLLCGARLCSSPYLHKCLTSRPTHMNTPTGCVRASLHWSAPPHVSVHVHRQTQTIHPPLGCCCAGLGSVRPPTYTSASPADPRT